MIDKQGRIFGVNIIDALIVVVFIGLMLFVWKGAMVFSKNSQPRVFSGYEVVVECPNCHQAMALRFPPGKPYPKNYETVCPICRNKVIVNRPYPVNFSYQEQYYKALLNERR